VKSETRLGHVWIVGPGRLGLALGLCLIRSGAVERLTCSGRGAGPPPHPLFAGGEPPAAYRAGLEPPADPDLVVLTVPDGEIGRVAERIAAGALSPVPVLHTSGVLGSEVLAPLSARGFSCGSLHPLVAVADPIASAERLKGAWYGIEGAPAALSMATRVVAALGGRPLVLEGESKPLYHAAAVFASNFAVSLLAVAERLMARAGVPEAESRTALCELASGAVANVAATDPARALTGPVARGDVTTVALHLERLSDEERRLYSGLAREALALARDAGLEAAAADGLERLLGDTP
jgi:predicted short-subunit dehydrogenase-like oxidoreductase (DUF2520 family)